MPRLVSLSFLSIIGVMLGLGTSLKKLFATGIALAVWGAAGLSGLQVSFPVLHLMKKAVAERIALETPSSADDQLPQDLSLASANAPMPEEDESAVALHGPGNPTLLLPPSYRIDLDVPSPLAGFASGLHRPPRA